MDYKNAFLEMFYPEKNPFYREVQYQILRAAQLGDVTTLKQLVTEARDKENVPIHLVLSWCKGTDGGTVLHKAAELGATSIVDYVSGTDIWAATPDLRSMFMNKKNDHGDTAAHVAALYDRLHYLLQLKINEADLDLTNEILRTPLIMAVEHRSSTMYTQPMSNLSAIGFLAGLGANVYPPAAASKTVLRAGESVLHLAARNSDVALVATLVGSGVPVDMVNQVTGQTALHIAVQQGSLDAVTFLLERGANPNSCDHRRFWILTTAVDAYHQSALKSAFNIVEKLLEYGACQDYLHHHNGTALQQDGTALQQAYRLGLEDVIKLLKNDDDSNDDYL